MSKINSQVGTSFNLHIILNIEIPRDRVLSVGKNPRKTEGLVVNKNKSQGRMSFNLNTKVNSLYRHQESESQSLGRDFPVIAINERIQIEENDGMRERERESHTLLCLEEGSSFGGSKNIGTENTI